MSSDIAQAPIEEQSQDDEPVVEVSHDEASNREEHCSSGQQSNSLDLESAKLSSNHCHSSQAVAWSVILQLAFQSLGVVYGDIGTSPLYVYAATFSKGISHTDDILGVLSLIFYTITLIPLIKYVFVVLQANHNGEGGTFAMYSLICRYARVGLIRSQQVEEDDSVSSFQSSKSLKRASKIKSKLENSQFAKLLLLIITMLGTSMVLGDGVLTPCISVLSAVGGIKKAKPAMTEDSIVWISIAILVCLFMVQRFGTDKVGYSFAPIICVWFALIGGIGVYNFIKYDPTVLKAINPIYVVDYFSRNKRDAWMSLGGVVLTITGSEALFADVGHFTVQSIQLSMCTVTYPALILAYTGQASFLRKHENLVFDTFFNSIPGPLYWPVFVVAVAAAIIASQAMISGSFSIVHQSLSMGCFPLVKVVHTSTKYEGQVYIPEVNYLLMLACIGVTLGFRTTEKIGNAYGIAVVSVMVLTSSLLVLIMILIWKTNMFIVAAYVVVIGSVELAYLSSVLYKFNQGGYLPLAFAAAIMTVMYVWNNVYRRMYNFELDHEISVQRLKEIIIDTNLCRTPGIALFYSDMVYGIPPIFEHYVKNVRSLQSVLVFVSIKSRPVSKVATEERYVFRRMEPKELNVFCCVVKHGYTNMQLNQQDSFESTLIEKLKEFIKEDTWLCHVLATANIGPVDHENDEKWQDTAEREMEKIDKARQAGVVHLVGESSEVIASKGSGLLKRISIDYAYNFLMRNCRHNNSERLVFDIPPRRMVKVGMIYEL